MASELSGWKQQSCASASTPASWLTHLPRIVLAQQAPPGCVCLSQTAKVQKSARSPKGSGQNPGLASLALDSFDQGTSPGRTQSHGKKRQVPAAGRVRVGAGAPAPAECDCLRLLSSSFRVGFTTEHSPPPPARGPRSAPPQQCPQRLPQGLWVCPPKTEKLPPASPRCRCRGGQSRSPGVTGARESRSPDPAPALSLGRPGHLCPPDREQSQGPDGRWGVTSGDWSAALGQPGPGCLVHLTQSPRRGATIGLTADPWGQEVQVQLGAKDRDLSGVKREGPEGPRGGAQPAEACAWPRVPQASALPQPVRPSLGGGAAPTPDPPTPAPAPCCLALSPAIPLDGPPHPQPGTQQTAPSCSVLHTSAQNLPLSTPG